MLLLVNNYLAVRTFVAQFPKYSQSLLMIYRKQTGIDENPIESLLKTVWKNVFVGEISCLSCIHLKH